MEERMEIRNALSRNMQCLREVKEKLQIAEKKLKINEERISKEDLAGKYKKPYERLKSEIVAYENQIKQLKQQIRAEGSDYANNLIYGIQIPVSEAWETHKQEILQVLSSTEFKGDAPKKIAIYLFEECDLEKLERLCELYNQKVYDTVERILNAGGQTPNSGIKAKMAG